MEKMAIRAFTVKPYEITTDTGKKILVDSDVVVGNVKDDGSFYGAVFDEGHFGGMVAWTADEAKERLDRELFIGVAK